MFFRFHYNLVSFDFLHGGVFLLQSRMMREFGVRVDLTFYNTWVCVLFFIVLGSAGGYKTVHFITEYPPLSLCVLDMPFPGSEDVFFYIFFNPTSDLWPLLWDRCGVLVFQVDACVCLILTYKWLTPSLYGELFCVDVIRRRTFDSDAPFLAGALGFNTRYVVNYTAYSGAIGSLPKPLDVAEWRLPNSRRRGKFVSLRPFLRSFFHWSFCSVPKRSFSFDSCPATFITRGGLSGFFANCSSYNFTALSHSLLPQAFFSYVFYCLRDPSLSISTKICVINFYYFIVRFCNFLVGYPAFENSPAIQFLSLSYLLVFLMDANRVNFFTFSTSSTLNATARYRLRSLLSTLAIACLRSYHFRACFDASFTFSILQPVVSCLRALCSRAFTDDAVYYDLDVSHSACMDFISSLGNYPVRGDRIRASRFLSSLSIFLHYHGTTHSSFSSLPSQFHNAGTLFRYSMNSTLTSEPFILSPLYLPFATRPFYNSTFDICTHLQKDTSVSLASSHNLDLFKHKHVGFIDRQDYLLLVKLGFYDFRIFDIDYFNNFK